MRKLLLASVATMGATLAMSGGAMAQPKTPPAPGTLLVHFNGYLQFEFAGYGSTYNTVTVPAAPKGFTASPTAGVYKLNPITTNGDVRLYPGFDGMTRDGLGYGVQVELRTQKSDAAVGANQTSGSGSTSGTDGLYVKRAYGYMGTAGYGFVRLGQTDSAFTLLQTGVLEAFGDGAQWNADGGVYSLLPTAAAPGNYIYADQSNLYATDKIVYISPVFSGFNIAAGYEPNSNAIKEGYGNNAIASSTSAALSSSPVAADIGKRRKNTIDGMIQYVEKYNGAAIKTSAGYIYGAPVNYTGAPVPASSGGSTLTYGYDQLGVYQAGAQVTYMGVTLAANVKGGQTLDGYAFKPKGARNAFEYIIGANYVTGPYVIGASFYDGQTAGAYIPSATKKTIARTLTEYGIAVGGNYVLTPNCSLFIQYLYGHKHQPGNAFGGKVTYTSTATPVTTSTAPIGSVGNAQVNAIGAGFTFKW